MISYNKLIEDLPMEVQFPMMKILDELRGEFSDTVTKTDFSRLEGVVSVLTDKTLELAEAQKRTELRLEKLTVHVEELAEAQKRTELRVEELAEAQKRTELRLEKLTVRVEELAEVQKKTNKDLGGLSNSFGYFLENEAIRFLPGILKKEKGIDIRVMDRRYIVYPDGKDDEINIYGEGLQNGREVYVIGESKSQLGKKDVSKFQKLVRRVSDHLKSEVCPVIVTHSAHPSVEAYAGENMPELTVYRSYELKE